MKRLFIPVLIATAMTLGACQTDSQSDRTIGGGALGAATGAGIGAIAGGGRGAAVGAIAGGVAGALIGRATTPNNCVYRHANGQLFEGPCP
jgi:uncharacterized protein YcfJ